MNRRSSVKRIAALVALLMVPLVSPDASAAIPGDTFVGSGTGAIDDGGTPNPTYGVTREVTFDATSLPAGALVTGLSLSMTIDHTWMGDLDAVLVAPDNTEHVIFSRVGATTSTAAGDSSNLNGTYVFDDTTITNFWSAASSAGGADIIPAGTYRTSAPGGAGQGSPAPNTDLSAAFASSEANGIWKLRLRDGASSDTGSVTVAELTIASSAPPPNATEPDHDFDGDGQADVAVVRNEGGSFRWWVQGTGGAVTTDVFGLAATDFQVPADYDGDGKVDIAVWRTGGSPAFYIKQSSDGVVRVVPFGLAADNPTVVGDWDGDGKADPAVYRDGGAGQSVFYYLGSFNNPGGNITFIPFGSGGDVPMPADYDGDGKMDAAVKRNVGGQAQNWIRRSSDTGTEVNSFGLFTDIGVPGDYDGDGQADQMVVRNPGGQLVWWLLERDGPVSVRQFGSPGDSLISGDHDGDGKNDVAIWRPGPGSPVQAQAWILRSSDSGVSQLTFGTAGDYPTGNAYVY